MAPIPLDKRALFTWVDLGDHRMFVVGFTAGGAPFGVHEWPDDRWIDESDVTGTAQHATLAEPF